jgi:hypothetical protein
MLVTESAKQAFFASSTNTAANISRPGGKRIPKHDKSNLGFKSGPIIFAKLLEAWNALFSQPILLKKVTI